MYLSKLSFALHDKDVQKALRDCQIMHKLTTKCFGTDRKSNNILYRVCLERGNNALYLYSDTAVCEQKVPRYMTLEAQKDISDWAENMTVGMIKRFDLLAIPTKKVKSDTGKHSQRRILRTLEERLEWMNRKADQFGFQLLDINEMECVRKAGKHEKNCGGRMHLDGYHYQGVLQITDAAKFQKALRQGIGAGKAYGFGMLMLT